MSILVFSLGLIGIIGFQATAIKVSTESQARTEAMLLADELIVQMSVSDPATLKSEFATGGSKYRSWFDDRVVGGSKLPSPSAAVFVSEGSTPTTMRVRVCIDWEVPGDKDVAGFSPDDECPRSGTDPWKFQTTALVF
ncbi:hypothetical protein OPU71_02890 [Niveibacterium sp. 24ML]|uniref:hypothetical protein n=1 Tax=Niveibacterium sp. 24ML TaxID=2985512 RepID=UPI002271FA75|nr:hypothetical protein [Niveibacterium sp. 24ML]MCX9155066.1 hypothetical protein [Niveibacterium sp. 24ML]